MKIILNFGKKKQFYLHKIKEKKKEKKKDLHEHRIFGGWEEIGFKSYLMKMQIQEIL